MSYVLSFWFVFLYLVTTGWIFDISLSCDNSINQSIPPVVCDKTVNSMIYTMYGHTYSKSMDQPGKVANPACGQLKNREN